MVMRASFCWWKASLAFRPSSPSTSACLRAASPGMAERPLRVSAGSEATPVQDCSETLRIDAMNAENRGSQHANQGRIISPALRGQSGSTRAEATSRSQRNGDASRERGGQEVVKFQLKNSCVLALQRGDITKWSVDGQTDGIVNAANTRMLGGGGVDGAIHRAAGPGLYEACLKLPLVGKGIRCQTGDAVITKGFRLPASSIVHTAGPVYIDNENSGPLLESSYKTSLRLAVSNGLKYLAFPAISCGIYGYPYDEAAEIALNTVNEHSAGLKEVHFVLFEEGSWRQWLSKACRSFERLE